MILKRIIIVMIGFFAFNVLSAQDLTKANELFMNNKYKEAAEAYEKFLTNGFESSELYYNLGNAYYKQNMLKHAILNYERALLLNPNDEEAIYNLNICKELTVDKIKEIPEFWISKWAKNLIASVSVNSWAIMSVVTFILALILFAMFLYSGALGIKKTGFYGAIVGIVFSVVTLLFANSRNNQLTERNSAIIFKSPVEVKSTPSESGNKLFILHEGLKVKIVEEISDWYRIKLSDGHDGWVKKDQLEII